ncbi:MAG: tRNA glutamyl-Q(34) synthetase GluQRS [Woeseiaceae bacterium]
MPSASSEIGTIVTGKRFPTNHPYVGRFAPSPTGPLHFGSLLAAVASYLEARTHDGKWLMRIEDIDPPRAQAGAVDLILKALDAYGFEWDGAVSYQSDSRTAHTEALRALTQQGLAYPCGCSRRDLDNALVGTLGTIYPGTCRDGTEAAETALRVRTNNEPIEFEDLLQGHQEQYLERESGDFVILRKDGLVAYQLAVVVDDHLQGITDVVRGIDLMDSTARQIWLQQLLGYRTPSYAHILVATNKSHQKLSKSHGAIAVPIDNPATTLHAAFETLHQHPPEALKKSSTSDIWAWAHEHWEISRIEGQEQQFAPEDLYQLSNSRH